MRLFVAHMFSAFQIQGFHIESVNPGWTYPTHHHTVFEILHCLAGECSQLLDNEPVLFQTGDWLLVPPGLIHATAPVAQEYTFLSFTVDIDGIESRCLAQSSLRLLITDTKAASSRLAGHPIEHDPRIGMPVPRGRAFSSSNDAACTSYELQLVNLIIRKALQELERTR